MKPAIDHLVLCVSDLDRARAFYERLGFTLTPRAAHPFGTANSLAQLRGSFLELLAVSDRERIAAARQGEFSFGAFNADFLAKGEGMSMLVFQSDDARRDRAEFARCGLDTYEVLDFSRKAKLPDGGEAIVSFSLAFVTNPEMPEATFFTCQQHAPQYFWKPEYQRHRNQAKTIVEVTMIAPHRFFDFFGRLVGNAAVATEGSGLRVALDGSAILVLDPAELRRRHGDIGFGRGAAGARFAGFAVAAEDLAVTEELLRDAKVPFDRSGGRLRIAPEHGFGAGIEFVG